MQVLSPLILAHIDIRDEDFLVYLAPVNCALGSTRIYPDQDLLDAQLFLYLASEHRTWFTRIGSGRKLIEINVTTQVGTSLT